MRSGMIMIHIFSVVHLHTHHYIIVDITFFGMVFQTFISLFMHASCTVRDLTLHLLILFS